MAVAFIKWKASEITAVWDDKVDDAPLNTMIKEVLTQHVATSVPMVKTLVYASTQVLLLLVCC